MMGKSVGDSMLIGVQDPIVLGKYSEPEPDLVLLRPRTDFYATARPHKSLVSTIPQAQPGWAAAADNRRQPPWLKGRGPCLLLGGEDGSLQCRPLPRLQPGTSAYCPLGHAGTLQLV